MNLATIVPRRGIRRRAPRPTEAARPSGASARGLPWLPPAIAVVCLLPFTPLLAPDGRAIPENPWCDYVSFQLPIRVFARAEMLAGRFPLWCPYIGCGVPLHAGEQASLCYPFITPLVLTCGAAYGLKLSLFLHVALGFAGTYLLSRRLALSRGASGFAALVHAWSAFPICHLMAGHVTIVVQYALAPWVFLALEALLARPGPLPAAMLALVMSCCFLAGQPQVFYYIILFTALWAAGSLCFSAAAGRRARFIAWGAAAAVVSVALDAVQLLPTLELVRDGLGATRRGALDYAGAYALDGGDVFRLLLPNAFGNPFVGLTSYVSGEHYHERVVYVGLLAPFLALTGLARPTVARWQWGAAWLVVLALAISLGDSTPLFAAAGKVLPGLLLFRCPGRIFCVATLLAALLAGRGLDALTERGDRRRIHFAATVLVWAAVNLLAYPAVKFSEGFDWRNYARYFSEHARGELAVQGILALDASLVLAAGVFCGARHPRFVVAAMIGLGAVDLGYNNVRDFFLTDPTAVEAPKALRGRIDRRFVDAPAYPGLSVGALQYSKLVPTAIADRCASIGTNEGGVLPGATMKLYRALEKEPAKMLRLASCGHAYVRAKETWEHIDGALPRARFIAARDESAALQRPPEMVQTVSPTVAGGPREARVDITSDESRRITIDVEARTAGKLVLADIYYPGWKCLADGKPIPLEEAHGVFRAARLDAGRHTLQFVYDPLSFRLGLLGTMIGFFLCAALLAGALWRR